MEKCEGLKCENILSGKFDAPVFIYFIDQLADYYISWLFPLENLMDWFYHCKFAQIEIN